MTTEEKIAVMQAYVDGKKIQIKTVNGGDTWADCDVEPYWNWDIYIYRIKPEVKYRPYKDYKEMVEDFCDRFGVKCPAYEMPLIWVKNKKNGNIFLATAFSSGDSYFLKDDLKNVTYLDGSPVGKKVEK